MAQSGDKTEKATPKKRRDAREKGQVMKSMEVSVAVGSILIFGTMLILWPSIQNQMSAIIEDFLEPDFVVSASEQLSSGVVQGIYMNALIRAAQILAPILGVAMFAGIASNLLQTGFLFTTKTLAPKLERISPMKGFKRIFSMQTLMQLVKSIIKVVALGYIVYTEYSKLFTKFPSLMGAELYTSLTNVMSIIFNIVLKMCLVMVIIAAADFLFQWWKFEKDLMMTKQEVKDEYKLTEGDPQIKSRIRQKQRQMSAMRMMAQVPEADVVITNPTHYAVALKYEQGASGAPVVIAKGQDYTARKIKEVAREHGIELVENRPLAQSLYAMCEVGQEIPPELYQAVADILVYVYRLKNPVHQARV